MSGKIFLLKITALIKVSSFVTATDFASSIQISSNYEIAAPEIISLKVEEAAKDV